MKRMQVGELKTHFSQAIELVKRGEEIVISYGRKRESIAVIVPYSRYKKQNSIRLGILEGKAKCRFKAGFEITTEELIGP